MAAGLGGASPVFAFRWTNANLCLVRKVALSMNSLGTGFTAGVGLFEMMAARAWSAADTGGGTLTITTNNAKRRTSFGTTLVQEIRQSTTATLTAGTRTLDANPHATVQFAVSASTNAVQLATTAIWNPDFSGEWPLVLTNTGGGEGFVIRATVPATGTWQMQVSVEWCEVSAF
jgi:hypothetical protein